MRTTMAVILAMGCLLGQEFRATLTGRVVDPSGAPVAGALVTAINTGTNQRSSSETDTHGAYVIPLLPPGRYEVSVEMAGFKKVTRTGIELSVNQAATLDFQLELGTVTEQVTVTAEPPLLEQANADRGALIDGQAVKEYPLNARNPFMLSMLVAGVDYNGSLAYQRPFDNGAIADWSINGSGNRNNEFLLDGAPNNAQAGGNNLAYVPPVDSVLEFKIHTNAYDAQYGKTGGGIVNVVLKSGTNNLHGTVYEFLRRNALDANSFQNKARGAPKDGHYLDQFGVQLDGPVYLPRLYNGRDKTFFLFNYEGYREGSPQPLVLSVPEMDMRDGDFSRLNDARGRRITIYDPYTGRSVEGTWTRDPFPGNIIPKDRINPVARRILDYFPRPNTVTPDQAYSQSNYFVAGGMNPAKDRFYNLVFKFDHNIGYRHRLFLRHGSNDRTEWRSTNGIRNKPGADGPQPLKRINDAYVLDWTGTLSPASLANVRVSFSRYVEGSDGVANSNFDLTSLGFPKELAEQLPYGPRFGRYTFDNGAFSYISLGRYKNYNFTNTFAVHPSLTRARGSRTIKAGMDMRWIQYALQNQGNVFSLSSSKLWTQKVYNRADESSGNAIASWLLGTPSGGSVQYNVMPIYMYRYMAPWVQHDWKLTPRLTFNAGFRMDFNWPPNERFNRMNRGFDPNVINPVDAMIDRTAFPDFPTIRGGLLFAGVNGLPREAADLYKRTWQPRLGLAYAVTARTILRGGWGRYYMNPNNDFQQNYGFSQTTTGTWSLDGNRTPVPDKISNPFPVVLKPRGSADGLLTYVGRSFNFVNPKFEIPHVDMFSFSIQRAITSRSTLDLTYSGSRGKRLQTTKPYNDVEDASFRDKCNYMLGGDRRYCDEQLPNPFKNLPPFEGTNFYTSNAFSRAQLSRPFPHFSTFTELMRNDGYSWYNSLQSSFRARLPDGTNLNVNYTFAKNLRQTGWMDPVKNVMYRAVYDWDNPHRFVASAIVPLPVGRGRRLLSHARGTLNHLVSGWQSTFIVQVFSGQPWQPPANVILLKDARIPIDWSQPVVRAVKPCVIRWNNDNTITWMQYSLDYGCTEPNWLIVPPYTAPRLLPDRDPTIRLQTVKMIDFSLSKTTRLSERLRVQFRAECFNLLNSFFDVREQFNNDPQNPNFGTVNKAAISAPNSNYPRQVQLAVKLLW